MSNNDGLLEIDDDENDGTEVLKISTSKVDEMQNLLKHFGYNQKCAHNNFTIFKR